MCYFLLKIASLQFLVTSRRFAYFCRAKFRPIPRFPPNQHTTTPIITYTFIEILLYLLLDDDNHFTRVALTVAKTSAYKRDTSSETHEKRENRSVRPSGEKCANLSIVRGKKKSLCFAKLLTYHQVTSRCVACITSHLLFSCDNN